MITEEYSPKRELKRVEKTYQVAIVGGGLAGVCAAITAARQGARVALVQDRPVLGGNASSEIRLWALGATSHMGNNNRWAREGGVINEILMDNLYRNREGNPVIFDTILIDKVLQETSIDLYLNTSVFGIKKSSEEIIEKIIAFNSQNSTMYEFLAGIFIDASGDGIVAFQSGVPFRMGAESPDEFSEPLAPDGEDYGELLGHTLFFYSKKSKSPVNYIAPEFALKNVEEIPKINKVKAGVDGCNLWWFEYGGRKDTVHDTEEIKLELWKVAYGVWNHIKNSGKFENAENLTLEWVGLIPGKRESRRFEGHYMLQQSDIVEQKVHDDAISFGGWAIDLHPADGVYGNKESCSQWHSKGVYQIPYRCYLPLGIKNLLLAGRIISTSHVAFGSTRVMVTSAHGGQAMGMAAAYCTHHNISPADLLKPPRIKDLQQDLQAMGHYIPGKNLNPQANLVSKATFEASSTLLLSHLPFDGGWESLEISFCQMFPSPLGKVPVIQFLVKTKRKTELRAQLRISSKKSNHTPDVILKERLLTLEKGAQEVTLDFEHEIESDQYFFLCLMKNEHVALATSLTRISGILSLFNQTNGAVSNYGTQKPEPGNGMEDFEFWTPRRRPRGLNMAFRLSSPINCFDPQELFNGVNRPVNRPNAWVAGLDDQRPTLTIRWDQPQTIHRLLLFFDGDFDHPMETVQMGHPENKIPYCIENFVITTGKGIVLAKIDGNYQSICDLTFNKKVTTASLHFQFEKSNMPVPVALFGIYCR